MRKNSLLYEHLLRYIEINDKRKLAILGGKKLINKEFGHYKSIGKEEVQAATKVVESGILSDFLGVWHEKFYGGPKVREFEDLIKNFLK